tara:strand:- start:35 stop:1423 length:1389 start_codon:yes stop_codon:yes gene_type:complete
MESQSDDRSRVPDLMKIGSVPSDMAMDVDTHVLDPVVNTEDFCRFVLDRKGFLHSFSKITLSVDFTGEDATFPAGVGVHSLIRRCALRIGTTVVAETDDFNHWMAYKSMFIDNDTNKERETFLTSRVICHDVGLKLDAGSQSIVSGSNVVLNNIKSEDVSANGVDRNLEAVPSLLTRNKPVFSVSVADLFPFLRFNQIPLYMIDQQVSIELHFEPLTSKKRCCVEESGTTGNQYTMDKTQTKFIADYIYYNGDMMEQYRNQNSVMNWTYNDYRLNKRTLTQAQLQSKSVLEIGGAGRLISKIVTSLERPLTNPDKSILNAFVSSAPAVSNLNNGLFTTNLTYNDHRLYPVDRSNPSVHFHDVVQAEQNVPHITRQEYNSQGDVLSANTTYQDYGLTDLEQGLDGNFHHICYRLNRNERVNSKGVELELTYSKVGAGSYTHRSWLELVKTATLSNGKFSTDFS